MADKKNKKPPALSLRGGTQSSAAESPEGGGGGGIISMDTNVSEIDKLIENIHKLKLSEDQKRNMLAFLEEKHQIIETGELKEHHFVKLAEIGYGNGGVVVKVQHKPSGIIMARKMIMLDIKPAVRNQIMRELKVMHQCTSPFIVGFFGNFCVNSEISICMQHMDGGSLDLIMEAGRIPVDVIARITLAVLKGLQYLRDVHKIIHRDVKPSNILVNSRGEINLCDFGVSGQLINSMANSFVGTRSYMAPERLQGSEYSILSDIWSLGISLIEMAIGRYPIPQPPAKEIAKEMELPPAGTLPPRPGGNPYASHANAIRMPIFELLQIIFTSQPPTLPAEYFDDDFREFVELCSTKDVKSRGDLKTLLGHNFVQVDLSADKIADWVKRTIEATSFYQQQKDQL